MRVLYVDDEPELREIVALLLESALPVEVTAVGSIREALRTIDAGPAIDCVACDYALDDGNAEAVYRGLQSRGLRIPFVLCGVFPPERYATFRANPIHGYAAKPDFFGTLQELIAGIAGPMPETEAVSYCRIRASTALRIGILKFDVYHRQTDGKYVRIFRRGDAIEGNESGYRRLRELEYVYLTREGARIALASLTAIFSRFSGAVVPPAESTFELSRSALETIADFHRSFGFDEEVRRLVRTAIHVAVESIRDHPRLAEIAAPLWTGDRYGGGHSVTLAYFACGIAALIGKASELTAYKLCLAAFLHDITLAEDRVARLRSLAELSVHREEFSAEEAEAFRRHPDEAARIVASFPELPPEVAEAVRQHHEYPDGSGFPQGLEGPEIHLLPAILIFAHELIRYWETPEPRRDFREFVLGFGPRYGEGRFGRIRRAVLEAWRVSGKETGS